MERVFAMDEARLGLITWFRRRWCSFGIRPPFINKIEQKYFWLYAAIEPSTGESFFLFLPRLDGQCFEIFIKEFRKEFPDKKIAFVLDRSRAHLFSSDIWANNNLSYIRLPAYSPQLNPAERFFEEIRYRLSNKIFDSLDELQEAVECQLRILYEEPQSIVSLTNFPFWRNSIRQTTTLHQSISGTEKQHIIDKKYPSQHIGSKFLNFSKNIYSFLKNSFFDF